MSQMPPTPSQWAPPPEVADPRLPSELAIAGMWYRAAAYIIDSIFLAVVNFAIGQILLSFGLWTYRATTNGTTTSIEYNYGVLLVVMAIELAISAAYWVYMWTQRRATVGMQLLAMQIGDATTGNSLTLEQGLRRWVALVAVFSLTTIVAPIQSLSVLALLASLAWFVTLLATTASDPLRQGLHDRFAHSLVVRTP